MAGTNAGVAAAIDHTNGLHDRFATLPDAAQAARPRPHDQRSAVHARPRRHPRRRRRRSRVPLPRHHARRARGPGSCSSSLAAAMSALFGRIGDRLRRPDVVQFAGMMMMMPFMFVSSAFAPLETMPGWMRAAGSAQPGRPRHRRPARRRARHRHCRGHRRRPGLGRRSVARRDRRPRPVPGANEAFLGPRRFAGALMKD